MNTKGQLDCLTLGMLSIKVVIIHVDANNKMIWFKPLKRRLQNRSQGIAFHR